MSTFNGIKVVKYICYVLIGFLLVFVEAFCFYCFLCFFMRNDFFAVCVLLSRFFRWKRNRLHGEAKIMAVIIALLGEPSSDGRGSGLQCGEDLRTSQKSHSDFQPVCDERTQGIRSDSDLYCCCEPCRFVCFTETVMDAHSQTYHSNDSEENSLKTKFPLPESIFCPKCRMMFKTKYQLAVHCANFRGSFLSNAFIVQTAITDWKQFQVSSG
ncbi:hypothetical protein GCK32_011323, partial [Trichostrongylus colubriformis]